jgi:hypothetical protein
MCIDDRGWPARPVPCRGLPGANARPAVITLRIRDAFAFVRGAVSRWRGTELGWQTYTPDETRMMKSLAHAMYQSHRSSGVSSPSARQRRRHRHRTEHASTT